MKTLFCDKIATMKSFKLTLLLSLVAASMAGAQDWPTIVKNQGAAVGKVEIRKGKEAIAWGSCFVIDAQGKIITNAHVVSPMKQDPDTRIVLTFPFSQDKKTEYEATIVDISEDLDVAVLQSSARPPVPCQLDTGPVPALMSDVLVIGYPLGMNFKSTPGFLQAIQDIDGVGEMMDLSAPIDPGNSGGPVFNKAGKVIGIVTAKIYGANFNLALPIANARSLLTRQDSLRKVSVVSEPSGARLFLNGIYKGVLPLDLDLYDREYEFVLEKDGFEALRETRTIQKSDAPKLAFTLTQATSRVLALTIATDPAGATVFINNAEVGTTPLTFESERGSKLRIKIQKKGFKQLYQEIVLDGTNGDLKLNLEKKGFF